MKTFDENPPWWHIWNPFCGPLGCALGLVLMTTIVMLNHWLALFCVGYAFTAAFVACWQLMK